MCQLREEDIQIVVTGFPSGVRDFSLLHTAEGGDLVPIQPLQLLGLERTADVIQRLASRGGQVESLAMNLALTRLLVPQLAYRGSGRHLVVDETLGEEDLRGETLRGHPTNLFARDLSVEQADAWRLVTSGERPAEDSLAELAWRSFTLFPQLENEFSNPDLGRFTRALYLHLIPEGEGMADVDMTEIGAKICHCRSTGFAELNLPFQVRRMNQLFRLILAVTVRWSGQLTEFVTNELIQDRSQSYDDPELTRPFNEREQSLLALKYGASRALSDINVGYLFGCGELLAGFINNFAMAHVIDHEEDSLEQAEAILQDVLFLLSGFRERLRRRQTHQRRELRQRRQRPLPDGASRRDAQTEGDNSARTPPQEVQNREDVKMFRQLISHLHKRDATRLQALIDAFGDRRVAAESLGLSLTAFSRQLRQTVFPNVRRAVRQQGLAEQFGLDEGED